MLALCCHVPKSVKVVAWPLHAFAQLQGERVTESTINVKSDNTLPIATVYRAGRDAETGHLV